ncbi:tRNA pseudouridine(38-40) synthase TruA [Flavobacteriaceae bacterium]|nr:tRNA pseudouridine(38-40) synthase TruA [Flavobacteriaceae bacterium]
MKYTNSYLVSIQYLGFRFHGWQKQKNVMSLHEMIDKTLGFVFLHKNFKTLGSSRTDAKVSANTYFFQLFTNETIVAKAFIKRFNSNAPSDLKVLTLTNISTPFNIIQSSKEKEYHYYFSHGTKNHPFSAALLVGFQDTLDIELMQKGAKLFEGTHYFHKYCTEPNEHTVFKRDIRSCVIEKNDILTANFFPETSYMLKVRGASFLRYQIRLMMGVLVELGKHNIALDFIINSLKEDNDRKFLRHIVPGSGLQLYAVKFT